MTGVIYSGARERDARTRAKNAAQAATALSERGVQADDCVAIYLRNDLEFFEASAACALLGAYATPINWHYTREEAAYILRDCDAKALVIHQDLLPPIAAQIPNGVVVIVVPTPAEIIDAYRIDPAVLKQSLPQLPDGSAPVLWQDLIDGQTPWNKAPPDSRSSMIYTSGTTGNPKGVRREPMSPAVQEHQALVLAEGFGIPVDAKDMRAIMTGPMYHSAPNAYGLAAARNGATIWLQPRFDAEQLLQMIHEHRLTHMHVVPTMFVRLLRLPKSVRSQYDLSSLKFVIHGAAPCSPDVKREMLEWWGPVIYEYYGSTENGIVTIVTPQMAVEKPGTVGKPIGESVIRVLNDDRQPVADGQIGEIYIWRNVRSDFTYHKRDEARREMDADGYLTNGDMGWVDDEGCLFLADRKNDMVISGGVNIYPAEIEKVLIGCPGVRDCAVFGIPDAEFGESLAAHVERSDSDLSEETVQNFLRENLARFKVPQRIVFEASLPREDSGKIFKRKLREPYWEGMPRRI